MTPSSFLAQTGNSTWMPESASSYSGTVDTVFYFILWVCVVMLALVTTLMTVFVLRYRRSRSPTPRPSPSHSITLELTWTLIPALVVVVIFVLGFRGYLDMATPPPNAYEIQVSGYRWGWSFQYPGGHVDSDLHVPVDRPVRLILRSEDVIHSLYVPSFRVKKDVVPGRYNKLWFQATRTGEFDLFCAEYCGTKHSDMNARVVVHEPGGFRRWLEESSTWSDDLSLVEVGEALYAARGCQQCHSVDGSARIGPTFQNLFGRERPLNDGSTVLADENYLRASIVNPGEQIAAGYENIMPTYRGRLKDSEIDALVEFMKSLGEPAASGEPVSTPSPGAGELDDTGTSTAATQSEIPSDSRHG